MGTIEIDNLILSENLTSVMALPHSRRMIQNLAEFARSPDIDPLRQTPST
jgi:hypothetical protein